MRLLASFLWAVVRQAPVIGVALLLGLILAGLGRALGLPLLFWRTTYGSKDKAGARITIGLAVGVSLAVCALVASLSEANLRQATLHWFQWAFGASSAAAGLALLLLSVPWMRAYAHKALGDATDVLTGSRRTSALPSPVGGTASETGVWLLPVAGVIALAAMWVLIAIVGPRLPVGYLDHGPFSFAFKGVLAPERPVGPLGPIHLMAEFLFLAGAATYLVLWCANRLAGREVYPAAAVCLVLLMAVVAHGFLVMRAGVGMAGVLVLALLAYALLNGAWRRARVPSLERVGKGPASESAAWAAIPDTDALDAWLGLNATKPVLVVVAADGGGIRAAVWASTVLTSLEECVPDFGRHVRLITGASGGMLGATYWASTLTSTWVHEDAPSATGGNRTAAAKPQPLPGSELVNRVQLGGLSAVASGLVFRDLWPPPLRYGPDRGTQLEQAWEQHCPRLGDSMADLAAGERTGFRPSLVLSPMIVEDGRRLVISNLDLGALLAHDPAAVPPSCAGSVSGRQAFRSWPAAAAALHLSTAVRLQASFPWVLPSTEIPSLAEREPRFRVVDAGYYDETGVDLACLWIRHHFERLAKLHGVILIQCRDTPSINRDIRPDAGECCRREAPRRRPLVTRGLDGLLTPVASVLRARDSTTWYRNDATVADLAARFSEATHQKDFFVTAVAEFGGEASLTWSLTHEEVETIRSFVNDSCVKRVLCGVAERLR